MKADSAALRELLEKATPRPWCWEMTGDKVNSYALGRGSDEHGKPLSGELPQGEYVDDQTLEGIGYHEAASTNYFDPALIVAAVNALPLLLDEVEAYRAALEFYADKERYDYDQTCCHVGDADEGVLDGDDGKRARAALADPEVSRE